jgi:hypothetical protein
VPLGKARIAAEEQVLERLHLELRENERLGIFQLERQVGHASLQQGVDHRVVTHEIAAAVDAGFRACVEPRGEGRFLLLELGLEGVAVEEVD